MKKTGLSVHSFLTNYSISRSIQINKLLVILKILKSKLFLDVNVELKFICNKSLFQDSFLKKVNPDKFIFKRFKNVDSPHLNLESQTLLKMFDVYGEMSMTDLKNRNAFSVCEGKSL